MPTKNYWRQILCQSKCCKIKHGCQSNYTYLEKKGTIKKQGWEADQVPLTAPINSDSNQLSLDAKNNRQTNSNAKAYKIGNKRELEIVCQASAPRFCQGLAYNLKLTITIDKTEKSIRIFYSESGGILGIPSGLFHEGFWLEGFSVTLIVTAAPRQKTWLILPFLCRSSEVDLGLLQHPWCTVCT